MDKDSELTISHPEIGICGLSCRLCPMHHTEAESRCGGCKSESRMAVGCPFITCAVKKKGIEFCWDCPESGACEKWRRHREAGKIADSFKCYQKLEDDIAYIHEHGVAKFEELQRAREAILIEMLDGFNEGRSKSYYCIAATVMEIDELSQALARARENAKGLDAKSRSKVLHKMLDEIAANQGYCLRLRK